MLFSWCVLRSSAGVCYALQLVCATLFSWCVLRSSAGVCYALQLLCAMLFSQCVLHSSAGVRYICFTVCKQWCNDKYLPNLESRRPECPRGRGEDCEMPPYCRLSLLVMVLTVFVFVVRQEYWRRGMAVLCWRTHQCQTFTVSTALVD